MSRCFPYPPPGFVGSKSGNGALIESIKLQRESEKAKSERKKEKKREKKEKRDRKEREKDKLKKNLINQDGKSNKSVVDSTEFFKEKKRQESDEQMARSDLTEEHAQPISIHKPSYSSDSTENSNKRKRHASSPPSGITGHGNVIRIRLPLRKHNEPNLVKENQCSTSGRTELTASLRRPETRVREELVDDKNKKQSCSTSGIEIDPQVRTLKPIALSPFDKEQQRVNLLYKELIGCWVPPAPPKELTEVDDQDWLFGRKHQDERQGKKPKPSSDLSCRNSFVLCPRAQYLPEADIYALPYTLPF